MSSRQSYRLPTCDHGFHSDFEIYKRIDVARSASTRQHRPAPFGRPGVLPNSRNAILDNKRRAILRLLTTCVHANYNSQILSTEQLGGTPNAPELGGILELVYAMNVAVPVLRCSRRASLFSLDFDLTGNYKSHSLSAGIAILRSTRYVCT
jgi:hypothetical protein